MLYFCYALLFLLKKIIRPCAHAWRQIVLTAAHALILQVLLQFCRLISLTWFSENQSISLCSFYIFSDEGSVCVCFTGADTGGLGGVKPTYGTIAAERMGRQTRNGTQGWYVLHIQNKWCSKIYAFITPSDIYSSKLWNIIYFLCFRWLQHWR